MVRLTVEKPNQDPEIVTFDGPAELTVGRSGGCNYCLDFDPMVSRMHAVLLIDPPSVRIKDLNSTNGLIINGEVFGALNNQMLIQPFELRDGDEVYVGLTRFVVGVFDSELDLGPELTKIKAEQEAAGAEQKRDPTETLGDNRLVARFMAAETAGRQLVARSKEKHETVADLFAVCPEIPGYQVDRFLAAGKTGNVYKARVLDSDASVIIKVVSSGGAFTRKLLDDFRREMEELKKLSHPAIVELLSSGDMGHSTFYTVSEFVNGENLASYLARCPGNKIPLNTSYSLLRQMADAICHLHSNNIVHRDIHPGGIMLYDDGGKLRAKFTEAGMARFWAESGLGARTVVGGDTGRLGYIAPEELLQLGETKPSSDVFSLGCVFYQMLTGRVPYDFSDEVSSVRIVEDARIRPIEELAPGLPETIVVIVERALSSEPEMRYQTACEMLEALETISIQ